MPEGARIYNFFPLLVGPINRWDSHLDRIAGMRFNWVFLNPFHMPGFSGSLYAIKDYYELNPLFRGRSKRPANDLVKGFVGAAKKRGLEVMMDLVVNHTAKDSVLTEQHPEWFACEPDGSLHSPFALDPSGSGQKTVWGDLAEIDYSDRPERTQIIRYFSDLVQRYAKLGVRGFRCDAAYKMPKDVWRALIKAGRDVADDVIFAAENLGSLQEEVLALRGAGFDYLFNSAKYWDFKQPWLLDQYELFRSIAPSIAFPETHDTNRFAADLMTQGVLDTSELEHRYRQAYLFSAVFSTGVMIPIGYEFGFKRNVHVVDTRPEHWEKPAFDLTGFIGEVNRMKASLPVLNEEGPQRAIALGDDEVVGLVRRPMRGPGWTLTLINPDPRQTKRLSVESEELDNDVDNGREITPGKEDRPFAVGDEVTLGPSEVRVFAGA